jgi:hypothetical protein
LSRRPSINIVILRSSMFDSSIAVRIISRIKSNKAFSTGQNRKVASLDTSPTRLSKLL